MIMCAQQSRGRGEGTQKPIVLGPNDVASIKRIQRLLPKIHFGLYGLEVPRNLAQQMIREMWSRTEGLPPAEQASEQKRLLKGFSQSILNLKKIANLEGEKLKQKLGIMGQFYRILSNPQVAGEYAQGGSSYLQWTLRHLARSGLETLKAIDENLMPWLARTPESFINIATECENVPSAFRELAQRANKLPSETYGGWEYLYREFRNIVLDITSRDSKLIDDPVRPPYDMMTIRK